MAKHELKIEDKYMLQKLFGGKSFEVRQDDRDYKVGDFVTYTTLSGVEIPIVFKICYVSSYMQRKGFVVFADIKIEKFDIGGQGESDECPFY